MLDIQELNEGQMFNTGTNLCTENINCDIGIPDGRTEFRFNSHSY